MILVLDYGSQYTQLIAKKLRRLGFSCQVSSGKLKASDLPAGVGGIILSGSPASVGEGHDPDPHLLELNIPILGLCFGYQWIAKCLGGRVESSAHREYGAASVTKTAEGRSDALIQDFSALSSVWMSHGDSVTKLPDSAELILESHGKAAGFRIKARSIWGLQFHPEVHHTPEGDRILSAFAHKICGLNADWTLKGVLDSVKSDLRKQLQGVPEVYCAVSGGVDSTVLAALLSEVTEVRALYVDHGFQRAYDLSDLGATFAAFPKIHLEVIDAREIFWKELKGVSDPETKRKIIGRLFIEVFASHVRERAKSQGGVQKYLGQGTIYSDVIESAANDLAVAHKIKSHHNVGGLPADLKDFKLVEPLRVFFKDEVRELGALLGIRPESLHRHPFPGPGLAIRCLGPLQPEKIEILRQADKIFHDELIARRLYQQTWQALCVLLPVQTVGVMGDGRSYEHVLAIRAVSSIDAMTAEASELPLADLKQITSRMINEVKGINRVVFDLTSKPPSTIEWE